MCAFYGICVITWGRGGDQRVMNDKHCLPCLPTLKLTNIKTIIHFKFLKHIHIYTFKCVYMSIQIKNHTVHYKI